MDVLLVVGSGHKQYREYILASAAAQYPLHLLRPTPPTWERRYLHGWTVVDPSDTVAAVEAGVAYAREHEVLGVLCYDEALILPAAHVAEALAVPGMGVDAVQSCRDKHTTRRKLAEAGVPQPRSELVGSLDQAREVARQLGYPVVLKPRGLGASQGVVRVDDEAALAAGYRDAAGASYPGVPVYERSVLVEEYVEGPEISVDGVSFGGRYTPLFLARKRLGMAPYFEETGHTVSADDPLLGDGRVTGLLAAAHRALGVEHGITHTELRLTTAGPRLIEVNGRLGGDLIPYLGLLATGLDPGTIAAHLAAGRAPCLGPTRARTAGIRFLYPNQRCRFEGVRLRPGPRPPQLHEVRVLVEPGEELRLPPEGYAERYACVICCADDVAECNETLDRAEGMVALESTSPVMPHA